MKRPLIKTNSKPKSIKFLNEPGVVPQHKWKKAWYFLYLVSIMIPNYILTKNMYIKLEFEDGTTYIKEILKGYTCDLGSIPRFFWKFWTPDSILKPALNHDPDYESEIFEKEINDTFFKLALKETNKPEDIQKIFHASVKYGGWNVYRKHTEESIKNGRKYINMYLKVDDEYINIKTNKKLDKSKIKGIV